MRNGTAMTALLCRASQFSISPSWALRPGQRSAQPRSVPGRRAGGSSSGTGIAAGSLEQVPVQDLGSQALLMSGPKTLVRRGPAVSVVHSRGNSRWRVAHWWLLASGCPVPVLLSGSMHERSAGTPGRRRDARRWIVSAIIRVAIAPWPARVAGWKGHGFAGSFIASVFFPAALIAARLVHGRAQVLRGAAALS
jgi:hypothetical protein